MKQARFSVINPEEKGNKSAFLVCMEEFYVPEGQDPNYSYNYIVHGDSLEQVRDLVYQLGLAEEEISHIVSTEDVPGEHLIQ
jgi:hypothetical protein